MRLGQATLIRWRGRLHRAQEGVCALCADPIAEHPRDVPLKDRGHLNPTLEHVIPRSWPGSFRGLGNLVLAHRLCNSKRGNERPTGCELIWLLAVNARLGVNPRRW